MLLEPKFCERQNESLYIATDAKVVGDNILFNIDFFEKKLRGAGKEGVCCNYIEIICPIPDLILEKCNELAKKDAFYVELAEKTVIYVNSKAGVNFAISYIRSLKEKLSVMTFYDYPAYEIRAYKIFVPAKEDVAAIGELLDFLVDYRYNSLMIELGGALEYKKRLEINEKWEEFCRDVGEYSGKGLKIANGEFFPWPKNVIHVDNGGGSFITQEQAAFIKSECDKRGIDVICEIPSLSHCDYLVNAYPEIRERIEDERYPDSYCPSNPKTYEVLFDVIDEALEIFKPQYVNIGHDELFSIGLCDKCKDSKPVDLFVKDVEKINEYLKSKGVKAMMWADMLSNARPTHGGAGRSVVGDAQYVPPLYEIRDRLPRDIIMINWWATMDSHLSDEIEKRGYDMLLGNLSAYKLDNWQEFKHKNLLGGFQSNWGSLKPEYMQRNGQNFAVIYNSVVLWNGMLNEEKRAYFAEQVLEEAYIKARGGAKNRCFEMLVTTDYYDARRPFYDGDFIIDSDYILGNLVIALKNGEKRKLCLKYGQNIGNSDLSRKEHFDDRIVLAMGAIPIEVEGKCFYRCFWNTDFADAEVIDISFEKIMDKEFKVEYRRIS